MNDILEAGIIITTALSFVAIIYFIAFFMLNKYALRQQKECKHNWTKLKECKKCGLCIEEEDGN